MSPSPLFRDRASAGEQLARAIVSQMAELNAAAMSAKPIVYALPRGGLPVAAPVARLLGCPLDIVVAKKISRPENPELAIGAVTAGGHVLWGRHRLVKSKQLDAALQMAQKKALAQQYALAPACPQVSPEGAIAILVDDGIATGMTMAVAAEALHSLRAAEVWICAPVAPADLMVSLQRWGDRAIVLASPEQFMSVSRFYELFPQVDIAEALIYLEQQNGGRSPI